MPLNRHFSLVDLIRDYSNKSYLVDQLETCFRRMAC